MADSIKQNKAQGKIPRGGKRLVDLPEIMKAWDASRNDDDPKSLHPGTPKKAYWICEHGHSYKRSIRSQTINGLSCPTCNSFGFHYPELIDSWHSNNTQSPYEVAKKSNQKVWWRCNKKHEWQSVVYSRTKHGCPYCAGLKVTPKNSFSNKKPELAQFWDIRKNEVQPNEVAWQSNKRFWFICEHDHEFSAKLNNISNGKWCPYCSGQKVGYGNSLQDINPNLAAEWNQKKNKNKASEVRPGSNKKAWWICSEGHEWEATIASRNAGNGCPFCSNRYVGYGNSLGDMYPHLIEEIDQSRSDIDPFDVGAHSDTLVWWICKRGHSWEAPVRRRTSEGRGCRYCTAQTSSPEIRLFTELKALFSDAKGREKINGFEVDVIIPSLGIGIEYDGSYFHENNQQRDKQKLSRLTEAGLIVFRMREHPLPLLENDLGVKPAKEAPTKVEMDSLISLIGERVPAAKQICQKYIENSGFLAEKEYKRILSYLPGPPEEESLAELHPELSNEWNLSKNHPLLPSMFHPRSGKKVWWVCSEGHEWEATIDKRAGAGRGCPYCANKKVGYGNSLADRYPEIAKLWYQPQNGDLTPDKVTFGSGAKVWWKCDNGHLHQARVVEKTTQGKGCGYCPGLGKNRKYKPPSFDD